MNTIIKAPQLPDLIYRDFRSQRIQEVHRHITAEEMILPERLHRLTLFTTFRCNLRCQYCHTIRHAPKGAQSDYTLARFRRLLDQIAPSQIDHIHFTGGEATLVHDLPNMITMARERGTLCSITTNGMAHPDVFRRLIDAGIQEIRISCDSHLPEQFNHLVNQKDAYQHVLHTIQELVRLRDKDEKPLHIIINMCVGRHNQQQLVEFVKRSASLNPDDIKLIPISTESVELSRFEAGQRILDELEEFLAGFPPQRFPLLRRKLTTVFNEFTWGLTDPTSKRLMTHCFVPLTERTVAGNSYYPCPVYIREGGEPLGSLEEDDFHTQQQKSLNFARGESCVSDPLCQQNCINCLRKFNVAANVRITRQMRGKSGAREPLTDVIEYSDLITRSEVWAHLHRIEQERRTFSTSVPYRPFLVIKPKGLAFKHHILDVLASKRMTIDRIVPIPDWNAAAMRLYTIPLTERRVFFGMLMARALPLIEGTSQGELLLLDGEYSINRLEQTKREIRNFLPPSNYVVFYQDDVFCISQGYLHSPDQRHYAIEASVLLGDTAGLHNPTRTSSM